MQEYIDFAARNPLLSAAWFGLAGALIYTTVRARLSPVKSVNNHAATLLINRESAVVLDIRSQEEYAKGHLAGAQHLPFTQIQSNNLGTVEKHKDAPIIVVCESGMTAGGAGRHLSKAGFKQVYTLSGGMAQWRADNLPVTKKR
ncbi:rhodanese-like domain-containing protein [Aeromonas cavernicola]|uniref:Rhodanese-like domain-containing protein n=1 Tax=Aeromonas cavernicola TaxID=1006623 RepID=A0A2H9U429_9GAMM|nr:rhodanese-like domain-containing protein [Aeromonas cavernicola]PJG58792.1 rhodanese-like domain-containing protein [Aeromonas cavernicola]